MSASSLSLPIFLRINFLISYLIVTDSQNTFDWHTQRALLNDKKAGAGCTSRAFKHPGRDVTAPDVWPSILTDYTYDSELDNADGVPLAFRRSSMFPEGNSVGIPSFFTLAQCIATILVWLRLSEVFTPIEGTSDLLKMFVAASKGCWLIYSISPWGAKVSCPKRVWALSTQYQISLFVFFHAEKTSRTFFSIVGP